MHFQFEGELYRIVFHHPTPTEPAYHVGHEGLELERSGRRIRLVCRQCEIRSGHPVEVRGKPLPRSVHCAIYLCRFVENTKPQRECVASGASKLNRKAKDQYTREGGRVASLCDALSRGCTFEFRAAAVGAYNRRKGYRSQAGVIS